MEDKIYLTQKGVLNKHVIPFNWWIIGEHPTRRYQPLGQE